ncbi:hypothetical protein [Ferrovibrio terrae]|uniref:hypothetical protein n=1 Tax=Ferrovibrio terrae TaxID=2594003 RepID=UPI003137CF40
MSRTTLIIVGLLTLLALLAVWLAPQLALKLERASPAPVGAAAPAPPPATPAEIAYQALRAEAGRMTEGRIAYNPPAKMRVGVEEAITIRIGRDEVAQHLADRMAGRGQPITETIQVGDFMRVQLDGGEAFRITPDEPQDRAIPPGGMGEWLFRVLPLQAGEKQMLWLQVFVRVQTAGREELISQPVLRREITVEVNYWWDLLELWRAEWKWFLGGLGGVLAGIGGYLLKRWWEARHGPAGEDD